MATYEEIKKHWDSSSGKDELYKSSWDDLYMLQKEMSEISKYIVGFEEICDVGCNNGYCDFILLSLFKTIKITGIDYSDKLILEAQQNPDVIKYKDRINFKVGNVLDVQSYPNKKFDIILIKRVLINLNTEEDQIQALLNLKILLKDGGKIVLTEAVEENWRKLNNIREECGLYELKQPWHNKYLTKNIIDLLYSNFNVERDDDYSSSYYLMSRVFNPLIKQLINDKNLNYLSEFNKMASLIPNFGDYGIQRLFVLSNKREIK